MPLDRLFPAQEPSERVLRVIRKHWFVYAIFWFVTIFMLIPFIIGAVFIIGNLNEISPELINVAIIVGPIYLLFILGLLIYGFITFYLDVYIITDHRIVDIAQNGFFKREIAELNLRQIQDVSAVVNGFFATLFHYGNVHIQTAGELPNFVFDSIPHPYETSKQILDWHEKYIKKTEKENREPRMKSSPKVIFAKECPGQENNQTYHQKIIEGIEGTKKEQELKKEGEMKEGERVDL